METLDIKIKSRVIINKRLKNLINKYGKERVSEALSDYLEYEVIRNIGDVYKYAIELYDGDIDALEEILNE